ncbi:hypothetical protein KUM39_16525 [Streptomyces sp. J2-1]|uniref:hypothetical protein n=1 Tax=Streptomyces corallincola TaxID=2851888 RepID=UPI001C38FDD8|nr:hypothetical protein [Streptomyces corallincola]MBV2355961.1 hypothetical protein [Streptomyces corallincola]
MNGSGPGRPVLRHLGAMHVSGAVLLAGFLVPPVWLTDTAYATPPGAPTTDAPYVLLFAVPVLCLALHVLVQIPAGLLATRLGRGRAPWARYAVGAGCAGALALLLVGVLTRPGDLAAGVSVWADAAVRTGLGTAAYLWVTRGSRGGYGVRCSPG